MKITNICLSRLSVNIYKKNDFRPGQTDSYTSFFLNNFLCQQLKKIRVDVMIINILEVSANSSSISNNKLNNKSLKLNNKYWQTYILNSSFKFKELQIEHIKNQRNLKRLIIDTMKVLETIMKLVEQKIQIRKQDFEYRVLQKSMLFDEIPLLEYFERIICKSDCIYHYKQEYYTESNLNSIKINILYAISSYINFENQFQTTQDEVNPTLPFYLYNLLESEGNIINQLGDSHLIIDYDTIRNLLNNPSLPNGTFSNSISSLSLRILTQIMLVWESQQTIRKPILVDFLSNMNMENYWEKLSYSTANTHLTSFIIEMFNILKLNEYDSNFDSELLRKNLSDNSCAVIDFMLTALYTQPLFMSLILKPDNLNRNKKRDNDLKIRLKRFFESQTCQYDMILLNKYLNLLVEIFKRDQMYPSFCQEFRQSTQDIFEKITKVVVQNFKPYEIDTLVERDLSSFHSPSELTHIHLFEFQKLKLTQLLREHVKHSELYQQMICLHSFQILLDLISKEYLSKKLKSVQSIQNSLKTIFENKQLNHIMNSLAKFTPTYALDMWSSPHQNQNKMTLENDDSGKGKIFTQSFFYLLSLNEYGYGRGYAQDASEIVFNKIDTERKGERVFYILQNFIELRQKSIKWSIEEIKNRTFDSWTRLFCLITSSGCDGYAMSTISSALPNFTLKQTRDRKIIYEHDQLCLIYPNYEIEFVSGFVNILSICKSLFIHQIKHKNYIYYQFIFNTANSQCVGLFSNLQSEIMKQILSDLKKGFFEQLLDQKLKFLLYLLNALRHLQDIDQFSKEDNKKKVINQIGRINQNQENQHSFSDSYKKEEAEDLFKVMTQILEEAVNRGSRVQICDFIQCLFLQLQVMEVLYNQSAQEQKKVIFINEHLNPYFTKVIGILMNLFAQNIDGLPILVSCLNSVLHIYPLFFILQFRQQIKALEYLINKIFYEKNETAQIFISVINLLRDLAKYPEGAQLLSEANIVTLICNTPIFKNIENEPFYWQNGERNLLHSFWCWSLSFFKEYIMSVPSDLENTFSSLNFLQTYFTRIAKILSIPQVLQNTHTSLSANKMINTEQEKLSLAYMEEIEQILELLAVYFCQANIFKREKNNDFEQILQFLTHCTVFLFKQGLLIQSIFMPVSKMEKKLSQIYDLYSIENSHLFTSMQTPSQTPNKQDLESTLSTTHSALADSVILY